MNVAELLEQHRASIVDTAEAALGRAHARHYESAGANEARRRLEALFDGVLAAAESRDLGDMLAYSRALAAQRFSAGYDLSEIQTAFNALEESMWGCLLSELRPDQLAEPLALVSTILGASKDALVREWVCLATHSHTPSLDVRALFAGTDSA